MFAPNFQGYYIHGKPTEMSGNMKEKSEKVLKSDIAKINLPGYAFLSNILFD